MGGMTVRKYGKPPLRIAVLHGGPGAPGYMAPVARELSNIIGVLEPLQTRSSLDGQLEELKEQLTDHCRMPVTLIGSSWGAVLALFLAARANEIVEKLILIGCAVFDADHSSGIEAKRLARLSEDKRRRYQAIMQELKRAPQDKQDLLMNEWGEILFDTDVYDPVTTDLETLGAQYELHKKVWSDFVILRDQPGYLTSLFSEINVPTTVIHGEFDPHPIEGIRPFLESCLGNVRFHILPRCGHYPWIERHARDRFFEILKIEIK